MEWKEWIILVKGLKSAYSSQNFLPDDDSVKIWYQLLQDLEYQKASAAIQKYILTNKFPPTVADIREMALSVSIGDKPLWSDGWEEVLTAMRRFGSYREKEAMESLTDITRKTVDRLGFRNLCMSENVMADRANFRMMFEQIADREHQNKKIPLKLTQIIERIQADEKTKMLEQKEV